MNKKKVTKHKGSRIKSKSHNESPEVFVLPPNILERLGINLGNIGSASESTKESQCTDSNIISKDKDASENKHTPKTDTLTCVTTSTENESSIIETAKLMKKSLFLSPTFVSQNTSVIQGEIEIADNVEPETLRGEETASIMNNEFCKTSIVTGCVDLQNESESTSYLFRENYSEIAISTQKTKQCDQIVNDNVKLHDVEIETVFDDHADEAYSSDGSNSNIGSAVNIDYNNSNKNSKIKIISEEIIHPSQFYKLKSDNFSKPSENTFVRVPISTMITNQSNTTICHEDVLNIDLNTNTDPSVANECNMLVQNVKLDTPADISAVDIPQNMAACAVLDEISSEFLIVTQNKDELQQDGEILQMFLNKDSLLRGGLAVDTDTTNVDVPCHIDTVDGSNIMNYEVVDCPIATEVICADHDDKVKELNVINIDSDRSIDNSFLTKSMSQKIILENINNEIESEDSNAVNKDDRNIINDSHIEHGSTKPCEEVLFNKKELKTGKQLANLPKGDQVISNENNFSTSVDKQQVNQSRTDYIPLSQSVTNNRSESVIDVKQTLNQCIEDKNIPEKSKIEIRSPKLNSNLHKKIENRIKYTNREQKDNREPGEFPIGSSFSSVNCHQNNNVNVDSVIQEDKVREIAEYLSKFANMKRRNSFKERKMSSSKTLSNNKHATNSKSSIQGVEKPGGSNNKQIGNGLPVNTYERIKKERRKPMPKFVQNLCVDSHSHTQPIDDTDSNSFNNVTMEMELCVCDDFGQLMSYDSDNEHIHFWNNVKSDVTPDIIFSIYNEDDDNVAIDNYEKIDHDIDVVYPRETSTVADRKICWHEIKLTHENKADVDYNVDINGDGNRNIDNCIKEEKKQFPHKVNSENITKNKRKLAIKPDDNDAPPKKKYESTSKQSPRTEGRDCGDKGQATANYVENCGTRQNSVKSASTPLVKKTKGVGKTSSVKPSSATATRKQSFILVDTINDKDCPSEPVTDATNNDVGQPSTLSNEDQLMNGPGLNEGSPVVISEEQYIKNKVKGGKADSVQCGMCKERMQATEWSGHMASRHDYLAWKHGEPPLDVNDETAVRDHLHEIAKAGDGLTCAKCGLTRKYAKAYLSHIKKCKGLNESQNDSTYNIPSEVISKVESESQISIGAVKNETSPETTDLIKCAVCEEAVNTKDWLHHIGARHDYLAWKVGDPPLDVDDEGAVKGHLYELSKALDGLRCAKCGLVRKYVKAYLSHIKSCNGLDESQNDSTYDVASDLTSAPADDNESSSNNVSSDEVAQNATFRCGVCKKTMLKKTWIDHISSEHGYLAWKVGDSPLDINDVEAVRQHLNEIAQTCGGLTCAKCGVVRKTAKPYMNHVKRCNGLNESQNVSAMDISIDSTVVPVPKVPDTNTGDEQNAALIECGVCREIVVSEAWEAHIITHNYLAWKQGERALDTCDEEAVKGHLYELTKKYGGLTCPKCGITRKYVKAYRTHIENCDGPIESQDVASNMSMGDVSAELDPPTIVVDCEDVSLDKCALCGQYVLTKDWPEHRASEHNNLAWVCGEQCLNIVDDAAIRKHLHAITVDSEWKCPESLINEEYIKSYVDHIKLSHDPSATTAPDAALVKCGVCGQCMGHDDWVSHLATKHDYLAWKDGQQPFDTNDEEETRVHLQNLVKELGGLNCSKCGLQRKYVKSYLNHVRKCDGIQDDANDDHDTTETSQIELNSSEIEDTTSYTCGVCKEVVEGTNITNTVEGSTAWTRHIFEQHNYLAWKDGETPLNVDDEDDVYLHLQKINKKLGGLTCKNCHITRKYVKQYMEHIKHCNQKITLEKSSTGIYKCGVCKETVEGSSLWIKHLSEEHNYLAWEDGETPLDVNDEDLVYQHLYELSKNLGGLSCKYCNLNRRYVKPYLEHVKTCKKKDDNENGGKETLLLQNLADKVKDLTCPKCGLQSKYIKTHFNHVYKCEAGKASQEDENETAVVICGVCGKLVKKTCWPKHLSQYHNYLAWQEGDTPLDLKDQEKVDKHLYDLNKQFGGLTCKNCGKTWKYVKSYSEHVKYCELHSTADESMCEAVEANNSTLDNSVVVDFASGGVCAVCHQTVDAGKWIHHTQREHGYLAWREGDTPWNIDDYEDINKYLYVICKRMDGLTCAKCGIVRKYVKTYLTHIKNCNATPVDIPSVSEGVGPVHEDMYQCAMCKENVIPADWKNHAMKKHYNVTWKVGETPIDIKNPYVVEKYLKEYKRVRGTLKCNVCGATRVSFSGFYAHIITCGKTEEEIDMFRSICEICNNPYLCIYKNQHAMIHKVQAYTAEMKMQQAAKLEKSLNNEADNLTGKRRAAVKARSVIEKYGDVVKHAFTCQSCGYGTDVKEELDTHKCDISNGKDFSGDESSAAELDSSDDESESDVDSNISNEVNDDLEEEDDEEVPKKRIRIRETPAAISKVARIPFKVEDPNSYIRQGDRDFCNTHLTDEVLYPQWLCKYEAVPDSELARYMPPMEVSCKVKVGTKDWTTFNRFQCKRDSTATTLFVGASIVCISWVPLRVENINDGDSNFLAVACHNDVDCPRYHGSETPTHENLIQLWDCTTQELPKLVFGIAHDFGTVWAMDWCPSGARDALPEDTIETHRLGLLVVACSSGSAYIFSVPYPSTVVKDDKIIYKLKPVAELKMTNECTDRKRYQATSVSWSKQKGHMIILVGYADGSTAFYDLHSKSPLSWCMMDHVEVFYPYQDDRPHNTCITGTDLYPVSGVDATGCGAGAWVAPTGALLATRAGAAGPAGRARLHVASVGVEFAPHAGCAILAGDDAIMHTAISELVWVPPGRRLGAVRAVAGCARCGRLVASMPPTLRVMRPHPAYDLKKQVVGMLEMTHLARKRKQVNDELAMTIEPLTYADAVSKYGIEFKTINRNDRALQHQCASKPKAHCPERFPLADVKSMAFCPSRKLHDKLAVATHAGIVFITTLR